MIRRGLLSGIGAAAFLLFAVFIGLMILGSILQALGFE